MHYRADLDGLRAVAVVAVVVYHLLPSAAPGGYVGVDVFFVLSGYLITALTLRRIDAGAFSLGEFFVRRARRLLPALFAVLLACVVAGQLLYGEAARAELGEAVVASALFGANLHFFAALDYFTAPLETQPLLHLWSLGVEEQFYLVAPLGLMALASRRRWLVVAVAAATLVSLGASAVALSWSPSAAFYLLPFRAWELGLGVLLALLPAGWRAPRGAGLLGALLVAASVFAYDHATPFPGPAALLPCVGAALVVAAGPNGGVNRALSRGPLPWLGRLSYSLYLWHWPVFVFASFLLMRPVAAVEALGLGLLSLGLAVASYYGVEQPLRHGWPSAPRRRVMAVAASGVGVAVVIGLSLLGGNRQPYAAPPLGRSLSAQLDAPEADCDRVAARKHPLRVCRFGPEEPPDLVLWGDSHAGSLTPAVRAVGEAAQRPGLVVAKADCPPMFGVVRRDLPAAHRCDAHNLAVKERIARLRPETVVLVARWPLVMSGTRYGDAHRSPPVWEQAGSRGRPADTRRALDETVAWLRSIGAEVVLVGAVPEVAWDVTSVLERSERLGLAPPPGPTRAEFEARAASSEAALVAVAQRAGAQLVRPSDALCGALRCRVQDHGARLYADDNHLTPLGALWVAPLVAEALGVGAPELVR